MEGWGTHRQSPSVNESVQPVHVKVLLVHDLLEDLEELGLNVLELFGGDIVEPDHVGGAEMLVDGEIDV